MFCFGGRRANLELQLPFIYDLLEANPDLEYHLWNLARDPADDQYIQELWEVNTQPRLKVINIHSGSPKPWEHFGDVYRTYTDKVFEGCNFVKLDDDVVFLETRQFPEFISSVIRNPDKIISAKVINNGACTLTEPELTQAWRRMRFPLLDVHRKPEYAQMCHDWFFDNWHDVIDQPPAIIDTKDWLSINFIGYNWSMAKTIFDLLGTVPPRVIAGRRYSGRDRVGDEGAVNMLPRAITNHFVAAHLYFGPQVAKMGEAAFDQFRAEYADIGAKYRG